MQDPEEYAHRVRALPYGPVEVVTGQVTTWLHGPYLVLSLNRPGHGAVMVSGAADDAGLAGDLAEFLGTAACGRDAELGRPGRLTIDDETGQGPITGVRAVARDGGCQLTVVTAGDVAVSVSLTAGDLDVQARAVHRWGGAVCGADRPDAVGAQQSGRAVS